MRFSTVLAAVAATFSGIASAQQYAGDFINNSLPFVPGSEITYWKIYDGKKNNVTLINYINHGSNGQRLVPSKIKRAVIIIHGLNRDPGTYESNMLSALSQVTNPDITTDSVAIVAPYFPNGDDKNYGYPWVNGYSPGYGSVSNCLVWPGSQWSAGGNNQYPVKNTNISSYTVLDQMVQYFDNVTMFPNMNQIVVAGHSLGGQTVQRYAALGQQLNTRSPVSYWTANPNSLVWMNTTRPFPNLAASCPIYDNYREGYTNFTTYPMTYGVSLVASGRANILANFNSKAVNYARGTLDLGDDSTTCAPFTTGSNRNERFFNFINAVPVSCPDPTGRNCDTVDFIAAGHDGGAMMASAAGQARLFTDNFYGNGSRSYDFGYPRQQAGDDPHPNPALNGSTAALNNNTYAGNMTYWGCWSDQSPQTLTNMTYQSNANTIELCTATCAQGGSTIAGLEFGTQCFCGSSLGYQASEVIESSCASPCAGNANETCGGYNRISLFSAGAPVVKSAPGTPETVLSNWYYTNCYTEASSGRALSAMGTSSPSMSLEYCASFCSAYKYFGTEYSSECYCGNSFNAGASVTSSGDCSMTCAGNIAEFCGAGNRLTVYVNTTWVAPSSTSAAPGSSPTTSGPSCPGSNGNIVTSNGQNFIIECGTDHNGGDLTSTSVSSFQQCIDTCAQNPQCVDVSLYGSACYLKSSLVPGVQNSVIWGARIYVNGTSSSSSSSSATTLTTSTLTGTAVSMTGGSTSSSSASPTATPLSCPASDQTTYVDNGLSFLIECGIDRQGGDLTSLTVNNLEGCIDACANNPSCVDLSLSGSACYLKSSVGAAINNGVIGARLIASGPTFSNSTSSSTVSSSMSMTGGASGTGSSSTILGTGASSTSAGPSTTISSSTSSSSTTSAGPSASPSPVSCPGANSTLYVVYGQTFLIECGIDHQGGDMGSLSVKSFADCIAACSSTSGCVDLSLSGSACYLKSSVGAPVKNGVLGAKLVPNASSTSSSSATSTSTSSSTVSSSTVTPSSTSSSTSSSSTSAPISTGGSSGSTSTATDSSTMFPNGTSTDTSVPTTSSSTSSPLSTSAASPTSTSSSTVSSSTSSTSTSTSASATPTKLSCPASNNTVYAAPQGHQFLIECNIDHNAGDMGMVYVSNFTQCVNTCDSTSGCVDVSLSGVACYMKKTLGAARTANGILGAKLIVPT